ncbi:hypothetical protein FO519_006975 [Halicephalobus sp. NKZ332]|nr:hypothetical protein FO519_006975 [Halicephalobus sp. NKZ332]
MFPALERIVKNLKPKYDDDGVDRLNYVYTTTFLSLLIVIIGSKQYIGEPLQCWMSAEFKSQWEKYIENYCFVENTYYWRTNKDEPLTEKDHLSDSETKKEIIYYQWVPIVLMGQLLLFFLPKALWTAFSWKTGFSVRAITRGGVKERQNKVLRHYKKNDPHEDTKTIATHIMTVAALNSRRMDRLDRNNNRQILRFFPSNVYANYMTIVYLLFKVLNCINVFGQLLIMNCFLNTKYTFWGIGILSDLWNNRDWKVSGHFPRVTYCDFMIREALTGNPLHRTVQCVLMINMFNEKIYIILWFWFVILTVVNVVNLLFWLITIYNENYKKSFILAQLSFFGLQEGDDFSDREAEECAEYLPTDAITILRLTSSNAGDIISSDIVGEVFKIYQSYMRGDDGSKARNLDHDRIQKEHFDQQQSIQLSKKD